MQHVGQKQLGPGVALGRLHGGVRIDVLCIRQLLKIACNQPVGLLNRQQQRLARGAGFDGDERDAGVWQFAPHGFGKSFEAVEHVLRRAANGQVVVARVDQHLRGPVLHHQLFGKKVAGGQR